MIQIHATKKLFEKLPLNDQGMLPNASPSAVASDGPTALSGWTAHVINIERRQCVLFVHQATRFPVFIPAILKSDMSYLERYFEEVFINTLLKLGFSESSLSQANCEFRRLRFDTATDRSTLACITQYKRQLEAICQHYNLKETTGYGINRDLARTLTRQPAQGNKSADYICPATEMAKLLGETDESAHAIGLNSVSSVGIESTSDDDYYLTLGRYFSEYGSDEGMNNVPEAHGFLTGVLLCQRAVMPSEWLPAIWGGEEYSPTWKSLDEATEFSQSIMALYNEIAHDLETIDEFQPMYAKYFARGQREYSTPWCDGFLDGFSLDSQHANLPEDAQMAIAIITLPFDENFEALFNAEGEIIEQHCEQVIAAVKAIHFYTRGAGHGTASKLTSNVVPFLRDDKVGRNDPCPCGSGKKFKKCCLH